MLVESVDGSKVLLGRAKTIRHASMLTCLSGFVEQVETIEEACRREVQEEAGIDVGPVHIAGSQPWPMGELPKPNMPTEKKRKGKERKEQERTEKREKN